MTDRERLERAAAAMGFANFSYAGPESGICVELGHRRGAITSYWNPLTDDGDALRLAVKLRLEWYFTADYVVVRSAPMLDADRLEVEHFKGDPCAATRRAIVRAAAEIKP